MKLLINLLRRLIGPPVTILVEDLHIRLLNDWIMEPSTSFIHPRCTWKLANGHPCEGVYEGQGFYNQYIRELDTTYPIWHKVVHEIIGSSIGGIVVGEYQFRREPNGLWYTAPFTHFYRIHDGQIVGVRYYMGEVSLHLTSSRQRTDLLTPMAFHSLN